MKIGVLTHSGVTLDAFFQPLVDEWERLGHTVSLAAGTSAARFDNHVLSGLTRRPSVCNVFAHRQLEAWASEQQLDVILTNTATASALARFPRLKVPVIYFCHGLHWNTGTSKQDRVWMAVEQFLLRNTNAVMCMNSDDRTWFRDRVDAQRLLYLDYGVGVPLEHYPITSLPTEQTLRLLWAGEFSERKRPHLMLEVARRLVEMNVDFSLTMIGQGPLLEKMKARAVSLGVDQFVRFPGFSSLSEHMQRSHLFVHTSLWEGLPRVMLEARAMCRQSVAFDVKGVRDIPDAVLVPNGDVGFFAHVVSEMGADVRSSAVLLPPPNPSIDSAVVARSILGFVQAAVQGDCRGQLG
jgi:glycosyltransferase involved in cell wall biosynthesis